MHSNQFQSPPPNACPPGAPNPQDDLARGDYSGDVYAPYLIDAST
jgi:hypothetical protein